MGPQYQVQAVENVIGAFLEKNQGRLTPSFLEDWRNGKIKVLPTTRILRVKVVPGSNTRLDLIDDETIEIPNISDFSGRRLKGSTNLIIGAMSVGYGTDAVEGKEGVLAYNQVATPTVRNTTFTATQQGATIAKYPLSDLMNENIARSIDPNAGKIDLPSAFLITAEEEHDFELRFPKGGTAAGSHEYLEFRFFGYVTVKAK